MSTDILDLYDLLLEQLRDLYDGEKQQLDALDEFDKLGDSFELEEIIEYHRKETKLQLERLEKVFEILDEKPSGEMCDGIKGLIKEALKLAKRCKNSEVCDAGLITSLQHINHYEIAGYGTAMAYAKELKLHDVAVELLKTLREEKASDMGLSDIAHNNVNPNAQWSAIVVKAERKEFEA